MEKHTGPELGIIEGYYGRAWSAPERVATIEFLAGHGYSFYIYAPKVDPYLRKRWHEDHPPQASDDLVRLARASRDAGVRFGIGLSPYEIFLDFNDEARDALARKLRFFDELGIDDLALLFDDMRGDSPDLAARQIEVADWVASRTGADRIIVCPTYYSDDPVLDRVFGDRPDGYLEELGRGLDPAVEVFWTGPEVVSREISTGHVDRVANALGREPFLWDNYPVNDGQRMSQYLNLRGFTGRPAGLDDRVAGHAINPALQPTLTRIPALTLVDRYARGAEYDYGTAFHRAAREVLGPRLGDRLREDLLTLQDVGLDRLGEKADDLRARYADEDHSGAREIIAWLDGQYRITDEIVATQ